MGNTLLLQVPGHRRGLSRGELRRKLIHMAVGLGAFAVVFLGPLYSAILAGGLVLFNATVWPRLGGRGVWREGETRRGVAIGIVLYPAVLLALVLVFWRRLEVVAAAWAILAFGDGMAALAGGLWGTGRLPWNPAKSWAGTLACWVFGTLGAAAALGWTLAHQQRQISIGQLWTAAALTALLAAVVESLPLRLDDNLTVPLLSAACLWALQGACCA